MKNFKLLRQRSYKILIMALFTMILLPQTTFAGPGPILKVSLSEKTPQASTIPNDAQNAHYMTMELTPNTDMEIKEMTFLREGLGYNTDFSEISIFADYNFINKVNTYGDRASEDYNYSHTIADIPMNLFIAANETIRLDVVANMSGTGMANNNNFLTLYNIEATTTNSQIATINTPQSLDFLNGNLMTISSISEDEAGLNQYYYCSECKTMPSEVEYRIPEMSLKSNPAPDANGDLYLEIGDEVSFDIVYDYSNAPAGTISPDGGNSSLLQSDHSILNCTSRQMDNYSCIVEKNGVVNVRATATQRFKDGYVHNFNKSNTINIDSTNSNQNNFEDDVITTDSENPFLDVSSKTEEGKAAIALYNLGIIGGFPDGTFKGEQSVNRAEAAKFLLLTKYESVNNIANNGIFNDVLDGEWYVKYIITAAKLGVINGYPDGKFRPANTVNTAEFLKMLSETFKLENNLPYSYNDVDSEDWFAKYAGIASQYELFPNRYARVLNPSQLLTRNEVAVAIYNYLLNR